ncbi:damage-control phosphatase ARMT1 family protein [Actinotalea subterranea]|uniref:damage-control phosphatase ARMT1 family protein n=1 Tax=Actinotalea subterranea TaxID=2607497 RepID=UPI0011ECF40C|nr:ARMT1-like domain-containing protein [Actinotalea subterranea]
MHTYLDCYACFVRQALSAARNAGAEDDEQRMVVVDTLALLQTVPPESNPAQIAHAVHRVVRSRLGNRDPYAEAKAASTRAALALYPGLRDLVAQSADPLDAAVRVSIAGNVIDLGAYDDVPDLQASVDRAVRAPLAIDDMAALRAALTTADHVLFLADNAGETVFDRVLVERLPVPVRYVVKAGAVLNDATRADAHAAGLHACATVEDNGSDAPGTVLDACSAGFRDAFTRAPLVIAKGQAHYETLSDAGPKVFCMLQVKCPVIASDIGAPVGSAVVRQSTLSPEH